MEQPTEPIFPTPKADTTPPASSPKNPNSLYPGLVLADILRLEQLIGKGGMGEVWLATHLLLNEPRAVKLILAAHTTNSQVRERFIQGEARHSLKLNHPNIARTFDLGQFGDSPFIVMEYVPGTDLKTALKARGRFTPEQTGELLTQIASGLEVAHRQGLVHRDLKPANILLTDAGKVKISDFGLVKDLTVEKGELTLGGYGLGTPHYMAPEQAEGKVTLASDIYALGVILYEMLTGQLPFSGPARSLLLQHATTVPTPPHALNPAISPALSAVIMQALAKNPAARPPSAKALAEAYQLALAGREGVGNAKPNPSPAGKVLAQHNLPGQLTSFIGREEEIVEVKELLQTARLVTLLGAGGVGKTRLSLEVGKQLAAAKIFEDGSWFVDLSPLSDPALVAKTIATTLHIDELAGVPLAQRLGQVLKEQHLLLIVDNCEHLVAECAHLLEGLLVDCPDLKIIATSRERLGVSGESIFRVPSLSTPPVTNANKEAAATNDLVNLLGEYEAIKLLVERARAVKPGFSLTHQNGAVLAQICRQLDGIPLALELAATRLTILTPEQLAARLADRFRVLTAGSGSRTSLPRQQTLRASIEWSYELLSPQEQLFLQRCSIFAGGWDLEGAEAVCSGEGIEPTEVLELLDQLVNKSLVVVEEPAATAMVQQTRYRLLETIRQFAHEQLRANNAGEELEEQHALYFSRWAGRGEDYMLSGTGPYPEYVWLEYLDLELDNLRAAFKWLWERAEYHEQSAHLIMGMTMGWYSWAGIAESREILIKLRELSRSFPFVLRMKTLSTIAYLLVLGGDLRLNMEVLEEMVAIGRAAGDKRYLGMALSHLGDGIVLKGINPKEGLALEEEGLNLLQQADEPFHYALALSNIGIFKNVLGIENQDREKSLELARQGNYLFIIHQNLASFGLKALRKGDIATAESYYNELLLLAKQNWRTIYFSNFFYGFAELAQAKGQLLRAIRLRACQATLKYTLHPKFPTTVQYNETVLQELKAKVGEVAFNQAWQEGKWLTVEEAIAYVAAQKDPFNDSELELATNATNSSSEQPPAQIKTQSGTELVKKLGLSPREVEVLREVARGLSNNQIAQVLFLSSHTVNKHLTSIYAKLGVTSRTEAARFALEHGLS